MNNFVRIAFLAAALFAFAEAASVPVKQLGGKGELEARMEEKLINEMKAVIESDLRAMDDKERDGFLSNLTTAITNAIEAIRERLPSIPNPFQPTQSSFLPIAAAQAEDSDKK